MQYWVMKSEPSAYSIDDLIKAKNSTDYWEGVRNFRARNFMRDAMQIGDQAFFYHSNCPTPGIAGIMQIVQKSLPDPTARDPNSQYFDPKSTPENPRWFMVGVRFVEKFKAVIPLLVLRRHEMLQHMLLLEPANRLSITPVTEQEWRYILKLRNES